MKEVRPELQVHYRRQTEVYLAHNGLGFSYAMYGLHVAGLAEQGLSMLESHVIYQLRFALRSYPQETHEANQELIRSHRIEPAQEHLQERLIPFFCVSRLLRTHQCVRIIFLGHSG